MPLKADSVSSYIPPASSSTAATAHDASPAANIPIPRMHKHAEMTPMLANKKMITEFNGALVYDLTPSGAPFPAHFQHSREEARDIECDRMLRRTVSAEHLVNYQRRWLLK